MNEFSNSPPVTQNFLPPGDTNQKYWSIETSCAPTASLVMQRNQQTVDLAFLLRPDTLDTGFDDHFRELGTGLGLTRWQFEKLATIGWALSHLPALREFLNRRPILGFDHLRYIAETAFPLSDPIVIAELDLHLTEYLEPRIDNQNLPSPRAMLNQIKRIMELLAPLYRPIDKEEKTEKERRRRAGTFDIDDRAEDSTTFYLTLSKGDAERVRLAIDKVATRDGMTKAEALLSLIDGSSAVSTTLHLYANADIPMLWADRVGWLTPFLAQPLLSRITELVLENTKPAATSAYTPTAEQVRYVRARDGQCRAPGCETPAHRCEIDHIIPFDAGGPTDVDNLHCLCKSHHQLKTARYSHLIMGFSGVQAWTSHDSDEVTYTVPEGPLSKHYPMVNFAQMKQNASERVTAHNERRHEVGLGDYGNLQDFDEEPPF